MSSALSRPDRRGPTPWPLAAWSALAVCGLIFALSAQPSARLSLWWDEGGSVAYASLPVAPLVETIAREDVHPPGYYLLLHGWMQLAGTSPFAVRLLSTLCAPLTAAVLFALGRRLLPRSPAALIAAAGLSLTGFALQHFSEARMYAPGLLLAASTFLFAPATERPRTWAVLLGLLIAGAYLHYGFIVIVFAHGLAGVMTALVEQRWRLIGIWAVMGMVFALATLPWLTLALSGTAGSDTRLGYAAAADWLTALALAATQVTAGPQAGLERVALPAILVSLGAYGLWRLFRQAPVSSDRRSVLIALALSALGGIGFASLFNYDPSGVGVASRLGFAALPGLIVLAALGVTVLGGWRRLLTAGSLAALMLSPALAVVTRQHSPEEDFRPAAVVLSQLARPGDAALLTLHWQDGYIESYAPEAPLTLVRKLYSAQTVGAFLNAVRAGHARVWIVNYRASYGDPSDPLYPLLEAQGALAYRQAFGSFELALIDFPPPPTDVRVIRVGDLGSLVAPVIAREVAPGGSLAFTLRVREAPTGWSLFVHLGLPATTPVAQVDVPARPELRLATLVPAETPPGVYQLYVGLYDPLTGQRAPLRNPSGCDEPERACLGTVTVR